MSKRNTFTIIIVVCVILVAIGFNTIYISTPEDAISEMRGFIDAFETVEVIDTDIGSMVISRGKVNKEADDVVFFDTVSKGFLGFKWQGGGGHINRNIGHDDNHAISLQVLNETQNVTPVIFGFVNDNVHQIDLYMLDNSYKANTLEHNEGLRFHYTLFDQEIEKAGYMIVRITYNDGTFSEHAFTMGDNMEKLQSGEQVYLN